MPFKAGSRETRSRNKPPRTIVDDTTDDGGEDDANDRSIRVSPEEFMQMAQNALSKNDPAALARILADLAEARRKKNFWKKQYEAINSEVPEDAVVLTGADAEAYQKLAARPNFEFGKLPSLLETLENSNATLTNENTEFKSRSMYDEFGKTSGYNAEAVGGVVRTEHLHSELKDVTVDVQDATGRKTGTKTVKTLMVRKATDPKAPLVPFDEFVEKNVKWMWPALKSKTATDGSTKAAAPNFTEQGPTSDSTSSGGMLKNFIANVNASRNPQQPVSPLDQGAHRQVGRQHPVPAR